jgi:hypothetical protein
LTEVLTIPGRQERLQTGVNDVINGVLLAGGDEAEESVLLIEDVIDFDGGRDVAVVGRRGEVVACCVGPVTDREIVGSGVSVRKLFLAWLRPTWKESLLATL